MKTPTTFSRFGHRAAWALAAALVFAHQVAEACPGCKQATEGRGSVPLNGASIGFSLSIFFLLAVLMSILGGLGLMMYRSCRVLAAQHRATMARLEAEDAALATGLTAGA